MTLYEQSFEYVKDKTGCLPTLSIETGISYNWLRKFKAGAIRNPSVTKIESIAKHAHENDKTFKSNFIASE